MDRLIKIQFAGNFPLGVYGARSAFDNWSPPLFHPIFSLPPPDAGAFNCPHHLTYTPPDPPHEAAVSLVPQIPPSFLPLLHFA